MKISRTASLISIAVLFSFLLWTCVVIPTHQINHMVFIIISWLIAIFFTSIFAFSAKLIDRKKRANFSWTGVLITMYLALSIPNPVPYFKDSIPILGGFIRWQEFMLLIIVGYALIKYAEIHNGFKAFLAEAKIKPGYLMFITTEVPDELRRNYTLLLTGMLGPIFLLVPFLVKAEVLNSIGGLIYGSFFVFSGPMTWIAAIRLLSDGATHGKYKEAVGCLLKVYVYSLISLITMAPLGLLLFEKWFSPQALMLGIGLLMLIVAILLLVPVEEVSLNQIVFLLISTIVISMISSITNDVYPHSFIETGVCILTWILLFFALLRFVA